MGFARLLGHLSDPLLLPCYLLCKGRCRPVRQRRTILQMLAEQLRSGQRLLWGPCPSPHALFHFSFCNPWNKCQHDDVMKKKNKRSGVFESWWVDLLGHPESSLFLLDASSGSRRLKARASSWTSHAADEEKPYALWQLYWMCDTPEMHSINVVYTCNFKTAIFNFFFSPVFVCLFLQYGGCIFVC